MNFIVHLNGPVTLDFSSEKVIAVIIFFKDVKSGVKKWTWVNCAPRSENFSGRHSVWVNCARAPFRV